MKCRSLLFVFLALIPLAATAAETGELESLDKEAARNYVTKEGQKYYFDSFDPAIMPVFSKAMQECALSTPDTKKPVTIVFVIAADGTIRRMLYSAKIPFGECLASKLRAIKKVPAPPRDGWVVALGAANHRHEEQAKGSSTAK
jgi:hypothetical protein